MIRMSRGPWNCNISPDDDRDFVELVGEGKRAPIAKQLFLYGLNHSAQAFAEYAAPHEAKRRKRLGLHGDGESA